MAVRTRARADRSPDFAPPPRYEIRGPIASGGMGTVWSAYDSVLRREVAVKVLSEAYSQDTRAARRFLREARAAARLSNHPNVVSIYDVGRGDPINSRPAASPSRPFLVMEHLPGETVAEALEAGNVRPQRALRWLAQAAAAIDYGHRHDVVHRDIKPHNFLLDANGDLRIADFGVARVGGAEPLTRTGQLLGTAAYLSPEQGLGEPASPASDRYALAVTAFELLVGRRPFNAENATAQLRQHVDEPPPRASRWNPQLSPAVDKVLARGLAKRPQQRWSSATEFVEALKSAVEQRSRVRPALAPPPLSPSPSPSPSSPLTPPQSAASRQGGLRKRAPVAAALACAAAVVAFVIATAGPFGGHRSARPARQSLAPANRSLSARRPAPPPPHHASAPPTTSTDTSASQVAASAPAPRVRSAPRAMPKPRGVSRPKAPKSAKPLPAGLLKQLSKGKAHPSQEHGHGHDGGD
jgi:eukaryotic-like serine/threonine-protein kinase